jgi:protein TonB
MFEQSFVTGGKTRRPWMVLLAFAGQLLGLGLLLAIPLLFVESLPVTHLTSVLLAPPPPPPPPPPAPPPPQARVARVIQTPRKFDASRLIAPARIPKQVAIIKDLQELPPPTIAGVVGGVPGGVPGRAAGGIVGGLLSAAPPPPPPPPRKVEASKPAAPSRVRIGGNVEAAQLVREIQPKYPLIAKEARVHGVVKLKAIIARDGTVQNLSLISGQPLLVPAAMNAVKQWVYKPTYLNGIPVEVLTEVDVDFYLSS